MYVVFLLIVSGLSLYLWWRTLLFNLGRPKPKNAKTPTLKKEHLSVYLNWLELDHCALGNNCLEHFVENYHKRGLLPLDKLELLTLVVAFEQRHDVSLVVATPPEVASFRTVPTKFEPAPPTGLIRMARTEHDVKTIGESWLGGLPALGEFNWPRGTDGLPLHHLAHINLSTLSEDHVPAGLPRSGSLSFFARTQGDWPFEGKVVYSPEENLALSTVPTDLPAIERYGCAPNNVLDPFGALTENTYVRWAIEPLTLPMQPSAATATLKEVFPYQAKRGYAFEMPRLDKLALGDIVYWHTAQAFARSLAIAQDEVTVSVARATNLAANNPKKYHNLPVQIAEQKQVFFDYCNRVKEWASDKHSWTQMSPDDVMQLHDFFKEVAGYNGAGGKFISLYRFTSERIPSISSAAQVTLRLMARGPEHIHTMLPVTLREHFALTCRLPASDRTHQMFGTGRCVQAAVDDFRNWHMLLQIESDQMMDWAWGDVGNIQFWIKQDALDKQNWDSVEMTFESH